ncbi:MAG: serine hydrolase [Erysipelotrichaceae bacterium]
MLKNKLKIIAIVFFIIIDLGAFSYLYYLLTYNEGDIIVEIQESVEDVIDNLSKAAQAFFNRETQEEIEETIVLSELALNILAYIEEYELGDSIGIAIESLTSDESFYYNEQVNFVAASTYKVPLAMVYYDKVNTGVFSLSDEILYEESYYMENEPIAGAYEVDSMINIDTLLQYMIVSSDNLSAALLYDYLGGWLSFKTYIMNYSDNEIPDDFLTYDNVFTPAYISDVLGYLYDHQESYSELILDMQSSSYFALLGSYDGLTIAQKYGLLNDVVNSIGIVWDDASEKAYSIAIFTTLSTEGKQYIYEINQLCISYFMGDENTQ